MSDPPSAQLFPSIAEFRSFYEKRVEQAGWQDGPVGLFTGGTVTLWFSQDEEIQIQDGGRSIYPEDLNFVLRLQSRGRVLKPTPWWHVVGTDLLSVRGILLLALACFSSTALVHWSPNAVDGTLSALTGGLALLLSAVSLLAANVITDAPSWNAGVIGNATYYRYVDHDRAILRMIGLALIVCLVGLAIPSELFGMASAAETATIAASVVAQWTVLWLVFDVLPYYNTRNMTLVAGLNRTAYRDLIFGNRTRRPSEGDQGP